MNNTAQNLKKTQELRDALLKNPMARTRFAYMVYQMPVCGMRDDFWELRNSLKAWGHDEKFVGAEASVADNGKDINIEFEVDSADPILIKTITGLLSGASNKPITDRLFHGFNVIFSSCEDLVGAKITNINLVYVPEQKEVAIGFLFDENQPAAQAKQPSIVSVH